jgi:[protein-PII] uridylyltransferase
MTLDPQSATASPPSEGSELRQALAAHAQALELKLETPGEDGLALGRANARFLNECIIDCFEAATLRAGESAAGVALAAVGSFGRGAVALRSDADMVVVVRSGREKAGAFIEALLYPLWDAALPLGHQVLSTNDALPLAQKDLATATSLLDLRLLAGDAELLAGLRNQAAEGLFGEDDLGKFIDRIEEEAAVRHERFGGSVYLLEPDVKSGPGGLRDLDGASWAARARYHVGQAANDGPLGVWGELVRVGVLVTREAQEIAKSEEFLWRVRNRLHARAR